MVCQLGQFGPIVQILIRYLSHSQSLHLLWQSRHKRNTVIPSSADLICFAMENILLLPHLKQVYNEFSRASCAFSSCLVTRFNFSLAESKTGCSQIGSMLVSTLFLCSLKKSMGKTSQKITKDKDSKRVHAGCNCRENFMEKNEGKYLKRCKKRWRRY